MLTAMTEGFRRRQRPYAKRSKRTRSTVHIWTDIKHKITRKPYI